MSSDCWQTYHQRSAGKPVARTLLFALEAFVFTPPNAHAVDLGCGVGNDVFELLSRGWSVTAIDNHPRVQTFFHADRFAPLCQHLDVRCQSFTEAAWSEVQLVHANLSLPFCVPVFFPQLQTKILSSIRPGGRFSGNFFGPQDGWANRFDMTFLGKDQIISMFDKWEIEFLEETHRDAPSANGPMKHWHILDVVAKRR